MDAVCVYCRGTNRIVEEWNGGHKVTGCTRCVNGVPITGGALMSDGSEGRVRTTESQDPRQTPWTVPMGSPMADWQIRKRVSLHSGHPFRLEIDPFVPSQRRTLAADPDSAPAVSYGLTSYGYDVRLGCTFRSLRSKVAWVADAAGGGEEVRRDYAHVAIDPFNVADIWDDPWSVPVGESVTVPPNSCLLGETYERVRVPEDCVVIVLCKSTWARCFLNLNCTPLEPGWAGTVTLELANLTPRPLRLYAGHGIGQLLFFQGRACDVPYNKRPSPTYQNQSGPTPPRIGT